MVTVIIVVIISFGLGVLVGTIVYRDRPVGDLRVGHSDPDGGPYLFLELDTDVPTIMCKSHVMLRVKVKDFLPHK